MRETAVRRITATVDFEAGERVYASSLATRNGNGGEFSVTTAKLV